MSSQPPSQPKEASCFGRFFKFKFRKRQAPSSSPLDEKATSNGLLAPNAAVSATRSVAPSALSPLPAPGSDASPATTASPKDTKTAQDKPVPSTMETVKDYLSVAGSLTTLLIKRIPDFIDGNPVTMAFGLANTIIEISGQVIGNRDAVEQQIVWTSAQLLIVEKSLVGWKAKNSSELDGMKSFEKKIGEQLEKLVELKQQSLFRRIATHEDLQGEISGIFAQVNQAREELVFETGLTIHRTVYTIQETLAKSLLRDLKPSEMADHNYHPEGQERQLLRRDLCTPGTRVRILDAIKSWADDNSASAQAVYWLFGSAGSGKSTIAYTIANQFESSISSTTLGGNFFCSRQFESTRYSKRIIPTIVYHLAHQCPSFAAALGDCNLDIVNHSSRAQLEKLLVKPWLDSATMRASDPSSPLSYLIIIDAIDEIDGDGGTELLRDLLDTIDSHKLHGLKFLVTSRPNPDIVRHVDTFEEKILYRLEEVSVDEVEGDIETYLNASLPHFKGSELMRKLIEITGGLFISAATIVKYLSTRHPAEQKIALKKLLSNAPRPNGKSAAVATAALDQLYNEVLSEAFDGLDDDIFAHRLRILHAFLCTAERTSTAVVARLFPLVAEEDEEDGDIELDNDPVFGPTAVADDVIGRLYSVLYVENGNVLSYHKSFPDFIFDQSRSGRFWCDQVAHHQLLASSCLRLMEKGLRFNIANIPSSYLLDKDNKNLQGEVQKNISLDLRYACQYWTHHLEASEPCHEDEDTPLLDALTDFLDIRALFWIEAMNLLGCLGSCDPMLRAARDFVAQANPTLQKAFAEAANFALYFSGSPASSSTPHLYLSALSTWPHTSYPFSQWKSRFSGIPKFTSTEWRSSALMSVTPEHEVWAVAISKDGKLIVSGSHDNLVRIWDASVGKLLEVLEGHTAPVSSVSFSKDDTRIVSTSTDKTIRMWDVKTGKELRVFRGHGRAVWSAEMSADGTRIVSGSGDTSVCLWDTETGDLVEVLKGHTGAVTSVAFSSHAEWIVSGSADQTVRIWDAHTGEILENGLLKGHTNTVHSVAFSPDDGSVISGSYDMTIGMWDAVAGEVVAILETRGMKEVWTVAFSGDGSKVASGSRDRIVRIWDSYSGEIVGMLEGHSNGVGAVAFSADGSRIVSGAPDKTVRVWDVSTAIRPEGSSSSKKKQAIDSADGHTGDIVCLSVSHDGTRIASGSRDTTIRLWDTKTGKLLLLLDGHTDDITSVAFSKDDRRILSGSTDKTMRVWDASTGEILNVIESEFDIWSTQTSPDASQMIVGSRNNHIVRIWDIVTGKVIQSLEGHTSSVGTVTFSANGKRVATGSDDKTARVWDPSSGEAVWVLEGHTDEIASVQFSGDGTRLASASVDKSARVWDMGTGACVWVLNGHANVVASVAFSPDGSVLASSSTDRTIRLWDTATGKVREVLEGHTYGVPMVLFLGGGERVVSCSGDKSIRIWDISPVLRGRTDALTRPYSIEKRLDAPSGVLRRTGWLLSNEDDESGPLMFVPLEVMLPDPSNVLVIPASAASSVDFSNAAMGPEWQSCFSYPA